MPPKPSIITVSSRAFGLALLIYLWLTASGFASVFYVATNGFDTNPGTSNRPFATITKAQADAASGDIVYLRGGTYYLNNSNLTATNAPWAIVNNLTKSGISYLAYPGELPVFDFNNVKPAILASNRVTAFLVTANNCVFEGFDAVGVQVTIAGVHTQSEYFRIAGGSNNRFDQLRMHDGMGNGWYLTDGASNLVVNCDAYNNRGLDSGSLGNTDGFGCHPAHTTGSGNILRGCRSWFNSDDGYDCINAFAAVTFDHCWSFYNGYFTNFTSSTGDGNGIKAGGYGISGSNVPNPIPRHVVQFCLTVRNRANGFYANHHMGGINWFNNTAYRNATDFNMLCNTNNTSGTNDVPGFGQVMKNNLGYKGGTEVSNLGTSNDVTFNFFTLPVTVATNDFLTLDESQLMAPRQTNGDLPAIAFAELAGGSDLIDAGTNLGFAFAGAAPDLGAFEFGFINALPTMSATQAGTNLIFTGSSGWPNGTNYLIATTNLALPLAQWTRLATNRFDAVGNYAVTNAAPGGGAHKFYGLNIP
jgi:pectate lyase